MGLEPLWTFKIAGPSRKVWRESEIRYRTADDAAMALEGELAVLSGDYIGEVILTGDKMDEDEIRNHHEL